VLAPRGAHLHHARPGRPILTGAAAPAGRAAVAAPTWERYALAAVAVVAGIVYVLTGARTVVGGDNGEFLAAAAAGGAPHPPGYPLFVLYLRAFSWLPGSTPAHTASLANALLGAAGVWLVGKAALTYGARPPIAVLAALVYAFCPVAWIQGAHAEVFALNTALVLGTAVLAHRMAAARGWRRWCWVGAVWGLAFANHHSAVLSVAVLAPMFGRRSDEPPRRQLRGALLLAACAGIAGAVPYVMFLLDGCGPAACWRWGDQSTLSGLVEHVTRKEYGTFSLSATASARMPVANLVAYLRHLIVDLWAFPLLGLVAVALGGRSLPPRCLPLWVAGLCAGPGFVALFNVSPRDGALVLERFYLLPDALFMAAAAASARGLPGLASARATAAAGACLASLQVWGSWSRVDEYTRPTVQRYVENTVASVRPKAVIFGTGDHRMRGFLYLHHALGRARDIVYVDEMLLARPWYRARVARLTGVESLAAGGAPSSTTSLAGAAQALMAQGWNVYLTARPRSSAPEPLASYPVGTVVRLLAPGEIAPSPAELLELNDRLYRRFQTEARPPGRYPSWSSSHVPDYATSWHELARAFEEAGEKEKAAECLRRAQAFESRI
jgi:hypothetical protein